MASGIQYLWVFPLLLSGAFTLFVVVWAQGNAQLERENQQRMVMADTLSLEAQLTNRLDLETTTLRTAAARLTNAPNEARQQLAALPEIAAGLDRRWLSVIWLDAKGRIVEETHRAHRQGASLLPPGEGISLHLVAPTGDERSPSSGQLIARYDPADLIQSKDFWWIAAQYDVQLLSSQGQIIVSTQRPHLVAQGESYHIGLRAIPDAELHLTLRALPRRWLGTVPMVLIGGFLALISIATWLLRRQMNQISQAELAWRTEAAWRQSLEESALVGLRARDLQGRLVFANGTFCKMLGYSPDELRALDAQSLAQLMPTAAHEARWRHRDGRMMDVMVLESPLVNGVGEQIGWMGSIVDVTERKRLEELERRQRDALANHARLSTLGEVASSLAHELNQPLTSIVSYSAGIAKALERQAPRDAELLAAAQALARHASQAGDIVHRIRARLTHRALTMEPCDINTIVRHASKLLLRDLTRNGVALTLTLEQGLPMVNADRVGIEQVVSNLIRNASDSLTHHQQVSERQWIEVRSLLWVPPTHGQASSVAWVRVEVIDGGSGLKGQDIETLSAAFYSTKRQGTGLGLAICRSILESHGGTLQAEDTPSGGAKFSFSLAALPLLSKEHTL